MGDEHEPIDGEIVNDPPNSETIQPAGETPSRLPAQRRDQLPAEQQENAAALYDPLQADPARFARQMVERVTNFDAMREQLRQTLVKGKDFGKIHVNSKCDNAKKPWLCSQSWCWSPWTLYAPGADKILGLLGLRAVYPGEDDYRKASLRGMPLEDVIMKCVIYAGNGQVVGEGSGAASKKEHNGSLNGTLKKAQKRARLDAVQRLPVVSSLFEDDFFESLKEGQNTYDQRQRHVAKDDATVYNQGALLSVMPLGKHKGEPFTKISGGYLNWLIENKPHLRDIVESAKAELRRRELNEPANESEELDRAIDEMDRKHGTGRNRQKGMSF